MNAIPPLGDLEAHVMAVFPNLRGAWVSRNAGYEAELCNAACLDYAAGRYWDARFCGSLIEVKKGKSIWLDLVRLAEVALGTNEEARFCTTTLFFVPSKDRERIVEVVAVPTQQIIATMNLSLEDWRYLTSLAARLPRQLNAQARLTLVDVRRLAVFRVGESDAQGPLEWPAAE